VSRQEPHSRNREQQHSRDREQQQPTPTNLPWTLRELNHNTPKHFDLVFRLPSFVSAAGYQRYSTQYKVLQLGTHQQMPGSQVIDLNLVTVLECNAAHL
jgi:hypothetical protein